jgi:hypothetical protein
MNSNVGNFTGMKYLKSAQENISSVENSKILGPIFQFSLFLLMVGSNL